MPSSRVARPNEALTPGGTKIRVAAAVARRKNATKNPLRSAWDRLLSRFIKVSPEYLALEEENDALEAQLTEALNLYKEARAEIRALKKELKEAKVEIGLLQRELERCEQELDVRRSL